MYKIIISIILTLTLGGWSLPWSPKEPNQEEYEKVFIPRFKAGFKDTVKLGSLEIIASENIGSKTEPKIRARLRIPVTLTTDLVRKARNSKLLDKWVLLQSHKKGENFVFTLITESTIKGDKEWVIKTIKPMEVTPKMNPRAKALTSYRENSYVIRGSKEHITLEKEQNKQHMAKLAQNKLDYNNLLETLVSNKWLSTGMKFKLDGKFHDLSKSKKRKKDGDNVIFEIEFLKMPIKTKESNYNILGRTMANAKIKIFSDKNLFKEKNVFAYWKYIKDNQFELRIMENKYIGGWEVGSTWKLVLNQNLSIDGTRYKFGQQFKMHLNKK